MIHDSVMRARLGPNTSTTTERRASVREPVAGEVVLYWLSHEDTPLRYALLDRSEHGYRVSSSLPVPSGTTGMIIRIFTDEGASTEDPVSVAWSHRAADGTYELGLRRLLP